MSRQEIVELLIEANDKNITLFLEGDKLKYTLKSDTVADESFLSRLRENKDDIKAFLAKQTADIVDVQDGSIASFDRQAVERIPLSFSQERLWFIDRLEGSTHYHIPTILKLAPEIQEEGIKYAVNEIVNRHEILRTVYKEDKLGAHQEVMPPAKWPIIVSESSEENLQKSINEITKKPFDLSSDSMLRVGLIKLPSGHKVLILVVHHIAFDGWSQPVFIQELKTFYGKWVSGDTAKLPPLPVQYADYAMWQRTYMQGETLEKTMTFWERQLKGLSPISLKTDYPRPPIQSTKGKTVVFQMPDKYRGALKMFAVKEGLTQFMVLFAAFNVLLSRYTGKTDICIGTPVANRSKEELSSLIGFFVNTLAIRCDLEQDMSFIELVTRVRDTLLEAYDNQEVPFEKIIERLGVARDISRNPLVQMLFVFQEANKVGLSQQQNHGNAPIQIIKQSSDSSKFDLTVSVANDDKGLRLMANYCTDLYKEDTIHKLLKHFSQLIASALDEPETSIRRLNMMSVEEEYLLMKQSAGAERKLDLTGLLDVFAIQAVNHANKTAISFAGQELTYKELDAASDYLAHSLTEAGVKAHDYVVVCQERSPELIVSILAIIKAGGTYVPMDPKHPVSRIKMVVDDLNVKFAIVNDETKNSFDAGQVFFGVNLYPEKINYKASVRDADQLAYIIYTSGSTGTPKGVMIKEKSLLNLVQWHIHQFKNDVNSQSTLVAGVAFDASAWEIWPYLLAGGTIHIIDDNTSLSVDGLIEVFKTKSITHSFLPTALVPDFVKSTQGKTMELKHLLTGGDALPALEIVDLNYTVYNNYGPTENTVVSTSYALDKEDQNQAPSIGQPIDNTYALIFDQYLNILPNGIEGDLYLAGEQLAVGYLNNQELTDSVFIDNPMRWGGNKIYKTGDRAFRDDNGNIFFAGRQDDQVSIRGFRVELGEVQAALQVAPGVDQCLVIVREDKPGDKRIVSYIVAADHYKEEDVRDYLMNRLPRYMIPVSFVNIDRFPLTANGKIDKQQLPVPEISTTADYTPPVSGTEKALVHEWGELLQVAADRIGIDDDFFVLGGHSLLATRLVSQINHSLSVELSVKDVFLNSNVRDLAALIDQLDKKAMLSIAPAKREGLLPLSFAQERLWFIDKLEGTTQYHISSTFALGENINVDGVAHAYRSVINRHEVLRTVYKERDGVPFQNVLQEQEWQLTCRKISGNDELTEHISNFKRTPFDLAVQIPIRGELIQTNKGFVLLIVTHHIASDGWSHPIFEQEMQTFYRQYVNQESTELPALDIQYADYAVWQQSYFKGQLLISKLKFWEQQLHGVEILNLPTDYPRPATISTAGRLIMRSLSIERLSAIKSLSESNGSTVFMTLLSAFQLLLSRYSGQNDVVVGTPVANRGHKEIEPLIGFFVNTLVLRNKIDQEATYEELLKEVRNNTLSAYEHQDVPFEKIVERVEKNRDMSRNPIFQVMFLHQLNNQSFKPDSNEVSLITESKFDITLSIIENPECGLKVGVTYCTDLFLRSSMKEFLGHYIT
ncbi:non-ribosomal peptide synthetase, partial [Fulvivirga sediminis]